MTKSAFVEVNITNPTKLAQDSQDTADKAVQGVTDLNDPNLMSVIEKQNNVVQFAGLTSQYNVLVQNAKDEGIDTTAVTTAYNNLNTFMADVLADPNHAGDIDRARYKKYQDAYNEELVKLQNAIQNNANNKFTSAASATSQAASTASQAFSQAQAAVSYADSAIAVQSTATVKAQSAADNAFSQAKTAIDTGNATSQAVTTLKDGSTLTIAQLGNGLAEKVANSEYASYKEQTASQIAQMVTNGAFSTYKTQTADLISSKVATKDFNTYVSQTADAISSKVESGDFNTYKEQTAGMISSKVSNGDFSTYKTQTANDINLRVTKDDLLSQINLQAGYALISASKQLTLSSETIYFDTDNPVIIPSANIDTLLTRKKLTAADISANTFSTNNGTFTVDKYGAVVASNLTIRGVTNLVYNAALLGGNGSNIPGWSISNNGCYWPGNVHDGVPSIGWNSTATDWTLFAQSKLVSLNGVTGQPFSASVWFLDFGSDTSLKYQLTLAFFDSNGNRIYGGPVDTSWAGVSSNQGWTYKTINNAVAPSNAASVGLQYWAYNGKGNAEFSSPMLTQTAQATGYQPDTGNVISAGEVDGSVINGSTINGTTFHGGDIINDANNTSKLYPTTISSDGHIYTTWFNPVDAMQTDLSTGALTTKYRAINTTDPNNHYEAYDTTLQADQIALFAGYTNGKDMSFTQSVTGSNQDGYVLISPLNGMTLHGDNQQITFNGTSDDVTPKGIIITPYGNINPNGTQNIWYVGNGPAMKTASFGINADQNVPISLYRQTLVDEIGALGNRLDMGRLFLHATDNDAQMYLLNDGNPAFVSPTIYNRTYSYGANMFVTSAGRVGRSTSASKYKLAIARSNDTTQADRLMTLNPASWNDKVATEKMAESLSNGEIPVEAEINLKRHYGLIAEDLRDAGLDEFLITGKDGQIEGIEYDRLWTVLIPKIKQLNNRINELERKTL